MNILRWVLIVASVGLSLVGVAARFTGIAEMLVIGVFGVLNLIYLLSTAPTHNPGKLRRMFGLWMTAKEIDLERRAQRP